MVEISFCCSGCSKALENRAWKGPIYDSQCPTDNLLCGSCSQDPEKLPNGRLGRQIDLRELRASLVPPVDGQETAESVPEAVVVVTAEQVVEGPKLCPLCRVVLPDGHQFEYCTKRCWLVVNLIYPTAKVPVDSRPWAETRIQWMEKVVGQVENYAQKLKLTTKPDRVTELCRKSLESYRSGDDLGAARLAWLAADRSAEFYAENKISWLRNQVGALQKRKVIGSDNSHPLSTLLTETEFLLGQERYLDVFSRLLRGNRNRPGGKKDGYSVDHLVALTWKQHEVGLILETVKLLMGELQGDDYVPPAEILERLKEVDALLGSDDPWKAEKMLQQLQVSLVDERARLDAERRASFAASHTFGARARANKEDHTKVEKMIDNDKASRGSQRKKKTEGVTKLDEPEPSGRKTKKIGSRLTEQREAIRESATT